MDVRGHVSLGGVREEELLGVDASSGEDGNTAGFVPGLEGFGDVIENAKNKRFNRIFVFQSTVTVKTFNCLLSDVMLMNCRTSLN